MPLHDRTGSDRPRSAWRVVRIGFDFQLTDVFPLGGFWHPLSGRRVALDLWGRRHEFDAWRAGLPASPSPASVDWKHLRAVDVACRCLAN